jgi:hypothetical protein
MIRYVADLEYHQQVFLDLYLFLYFRGSIIIEYKLPWSKVLEIIGKCKFTVFDDIIMTQKMIALEVIWGKDAVSGFFHICQLRELVTEFLSEELQGRLFSQLVGLKEMEQITFFL